jgi:hypothetical protein
MTHRSLSLILTVALLSGTAFVAFAQDAAPPATDPAAAAVAPADPAAVPSPTPSASAPPTSDVPAAGASGVPATPSPAGSLLVGQPPLTQQQEFIRALEQELLASAPNQTYVPPGVPSLFLTPQEYASLQEARNGFAVQKDPEEVGMILEEGIPAMREISLQGILFKSESDWTIWMNNQQMTPDRLPLEILEIHVTKDYVAIKWFDRDANQVVPVRLRPNQRFNLDARIFLPG